MKFCLCLLRAVVSTAMGAMLKGVFGFVFESKRQKHELELARETRANDNFLRLQNSLAQQGNGEYVSFSRRVIAFMGVGTCCGCLCVLLCTIFPQAEFLSITNASGEGRTEWLFGLLSYPASQDPLLLSSGHLAFMGQTALCGILGFYFGPCTKKMSDINQTLIVGISGTTSTIFLNELVNPVLATITGVLTIIILGQKLYDRYKK